MAGSSFLNSAGNFFAGPLLQQGNRQQGSSGSGFLNGLGNFFAGTPAGIQQVNKYNPQQQGARQQVLGMGLQGLQNPYQGFDPIEQRARSQFQQQTIPSLAERFTSMGGGQNSLSSPAFTSQLGQAGAGLEEGLAALRSQYGLQNRSQLMELLGYGLQPEFDNFSVEGQQGALHQLLPIAARAGAAYLTGGGSEIMQLLQLLQGNGIGFNGQQK